MQQFERQTLSVLAATKAAGICRATLYSFITSSELPSIYIGKRRLVRIELLRDWLALRKTKKAA